MPGAWPRRSIWVSAALPANTTLGRKGLPRTDALAYSAIRKFNNEKNVNAESGANIWNLFHHH